MQKIVFQRETKARESVSGGMAITCSFHPPSSLFLLSLWFLSALHISDKRVFWD